MTNETRQIDGMESFKSIELTTPEDLAKAVSIMAERRGRFTVETVGYGRDRWRIWFEPGKEHDAALLEAAALKLYSVVVEETVSKTRQYVVAAVDEDDARCKAEQGDTLSENDIDIGEVAYRMVDSVESLPPAAASQSG